MTVGVDFVDSFVDVARLLLNFIDNCLLLFVVFVDRIALSLFRCIVVALSCVSLLISTSDVVVATFRMCISRRRCCCCLRRRRRRRIIQMQLTL